MASVTQHNILGNLSDGMRPSTKTTLIRVDRTLTNVSLALLWGAALLFFGVFGAPFYKTTTGIADVSASVKAYTWGLRCTASSGSVYDDDDNFNNDNFNNDNFDNDNFDNDNFNNGINMEGNFDLCNDDVYDLCSDEGLLAEDSSDCTKWKAAFTACIIGAFAAFWAACLRSYANCCRCCCLGCCHSIVMVVLTLSAMVSGFTVISKMDGLAGSDAPDNDKGSGHAVCTTASVLLLFAFLCELVHMILVMIFGDELLPSRRGAVDGMAVPVININQAINNSSQSNNTISNSNGPSAPAVAPVAPQTVASQSCRECGGQCTAADKFCNSCGAKSPAMDKVCGSCGNGLTKFAKFCDGCGQTTQQLCVSCRAVMIPGVKFCGECGHDNTQPPKFSQA